MMLHTDDAEHGWHPTSGSTLGNVRGLAAHPHLLGQVTRRGGATEPIAAVVSIDDSGTDGMVFVYDFFRASRADGVQHLMRETREAESSASAGERKEAPLREAFIERVRKLRARRPSAGGGRGMGSLIVPVVVFWSLAWTSIAGATTIAPLALLPAPAAGAHIPVARAVSTTRAVADVTLGVRGAALDNPDMRFANVQVATSPDTDSRGRLTTGIVSSGRAEIGAPRVPALPVGRYWAVAWVPVITEVDGSDVVSVVATPVRAFVVVPATPRPLALPMVRDAIAKMILKRGAGFFENGATPRCAKTGAATARCTNVRWFGGDIVFKGAVSVRLAYVQGAPAKIAGRFSGTSFNDYDGTYKPYAFGFAYDVASETVK
ncbi:MAG: hypothetical protein JWM98_2305 [Thermoleophilia bacterium]|nr:hypothetical protein [Thermoleophilia bacterium]